MDSIQYSEIEPRVFRKLVRNGFFSGPTAGVCGSYAQANLLVLPERYAHDFLLFAQRNSRACPVLEVLQPGSRVPSVSGRDADMARDIPGYRVYENGEHIGDYFDVSPWWRSDFVSFLIGCSFSFESELLAAGVPIRHIEEGCNVPMYRTSLECEPSGPFRGPTVVSMRPMPPELADRAAAVTSKMSRVHGPPIHIGDPSAIGIRDLSRPDFGDSVSVKEGEVPVFWACGVTPQLAVMNAKPDIAIAHVPGHMFVTDILNSDLKDEGHENH